MPTSRAAVLPLLMVFAATAVQASERACDIQPFRGATSPAGADTTASMVNRGQSCRFVNYGLPEERANPAHSGRIIVTPKNGTASFQAPEAIYTPNRGFAGTDEFTYEAMAMGRGSAGVRLLVRVRVVVTAAQ